MLGATTKKGRATTGMGIKFYTSEKYWGPHHRQSPEDLHLFLCWADGDLKPNVKGFMEHKEGIFVDMIKG